MNTNTVTVNKIAEAASLLGSRAANLAVMQALTDASNSRPTSPPTSATTTT